MNNDDSLSTIQIWKIMVVNNIFHLLNYQIILMLILEY